MKRQFRYNTGQPVKVGDRVRTGSGHFGVVEEIICPGTKASRALSCPEGGVLISEDWDGVLSPLLMEPPDGEYWEDIEFLSRKTE